MHIIELKNKIQNIVYKANNLKNKYIEEKNISVNYACIFCQNDKEFTELQILTKTFGKVIKETTTGPLFEIEHLQTVAGELKLLKIRTPDPTRPEEGDADFTIANFEEFEKKYLGKHNFKLIERVDMKMIELVDKDFDVRVYFSNPPLIKLLDI